MNLLRLAWRDAWGSPTRMILLSIGVAVGVSALALILALSAGVQGIVLRKVIGVLPDQVVVEPVRYGIGPVSLQGGPSLNKALVKRLAAMSGVRAVYSRVRIPLPAHIDAEYRGHSFGSDLLVEAVDPKLVSADLTNPSLFHAPPPGQPMPVVLPSAMIDVLNMGFAVNTGLPQLNPSIIIGRHFTLTIGASSFKSGPSITLRAVIVGISPRVFVGGPSIPLDALPEITTALKARGVTLPDLAASSLTVMLTDPGALASVSEKIQRLGLAVPQLDKARTVKAVIRAITLSLGMFATLILVVAATGIGNGLTLMVKDESGEIGLFRAVGASRRQILTLYQMRAAIVGLCGGLAGVLTCIVISNVVNFIAAWYVPGLLNGSERVVALSVYDLGTGLAFGLVASLLAGLWPARQAARLDPAAVLRER